MAVRVLPGGSGVRFHLRLTPKGGRDAVEGWMEMEGARCLKARVSAVPEHGKANAALAALLAKTLGVSKSSVLIAGGEKSRMKTIEVAGDAALLAAKLETLGEAN
jgi:uncharacterized protein YggU (UPF0235/DUF167 family)